MLFRGKNIKKVWAIVALFVMASMVLSMSHVGY